MLYVLIEAERAWIKKLQKENEQITLQSRIILEGRGWETEQSDIDVLELHFTKKPVSPFSKSLIQDSEWFSLSPPEKYAFNLCERICSYLKTNKQTKHS